MKCFHWGIISIIFLGSFVVNFCSIEASSLQEEQKLDSKQLARLEKSLDHLRIPLSALQLLLMENPFQAGKKKAGNQYLALEEARGFRECLYFFSIQIDAQNSDPEHYRPYFKVLGDPIYKERIISPLIMRVLGVYGKEDKDYYQGTFVIHHQNLTPFRFHILAIERKKEQQLKQGAAFYILSGNSKQNSTQLSTLCKEEYVLTKEGKFVDDDGNLIKENVETSFSLEEVIGSKISTDITRKLSPKPKAFRRPKKSSDSPPSIVLKEEKAEIPQAESSSRAPIDQKSPQLPPERGGRRKGNMTLLREETDEILKMFQDEMREKDQKTSTSVEAPPSMPETTIPNLSTQSVESIQLESTRAVSSPGRKRNLAFVGEDVATLMKKK